MKKQLTSSSDPIVSVVLGSLNRLIYLRQTIDTIRQELKDLKHEIFVVDGGSTDGTMEWLVNQKDITTIIQHNKIKKKSWGYFMNLVFKSAQGKYVCMLSDDCLVIPGAIKNGIRKFDPKTGAVAFYWRNFPDEAKYHVDYTLRGKLFVNHGLFLNKALKEVGYIDEEGYHFYHADGDLCLKIWKKGYKIVDSQNSFIEHFRDATKSIKISNSKTQRTDWKNYLKKWKINKNDQLDGIKYRSFIDPSKTYLKFPNGRMVKLLYETSSWLRRKLPSGLLKH